MCCAVRSPSCLILIWSCCLKSGEPDLPFQISRGEKPIRGQQKLQGCPSKASSFRSTRRLVANELRPAQIGQRKSGWQMHKEWRQKKSLRSMCAKISYALVDSYNALAKLILDECSMPRLRLRLLHGMVFNMSRAACRMACRRES